MRSTLAPSWHPLLEERGVTPLKNAGGTGGFLFTETGLGLCPQHLIYSHPNIELRCLKNDALCPLETPSQLGTSGFSPIFHKNAVQPSLALHSRGVLIWQQPQLLPPQRPYAHPGCSCEVARDYPYCSPECVSTAKVAAESVTAPCKTVQL